jgi:tetratricopeptide (TPR) repeat protein
VSGASSDQTVRRNILMDQTTGPTLVSLRRAASDRPRDARAAHSLGLAHAARREYDEAAEWLTRATTLDPLRAASFFELAEVRSWQQRWEDARAAYRRGLDIAPDDADAWLRLGRRAYTIGDTADALEAYRRSVACNPRDFEAYAGIGAIVLDAAEADVEALVADRVGPLGDRLALNLGVATALARRGRYHEALVRWRRLLFDASPHPAAVDGAAQAETVLGDLDAAERLYVGALSLIPDDPLSLTLDDAKLGVNYLQLLCRRGRIDALSAYLRESPIGRYLSSCALDPDRPVADIWDGTQDLEAKTILVDCRGGYGDILQYCRFASWIARRGARVIVQGLPALTTLLETLTGVEKVVAPYDECPAYDYHCRPDHAGFLLPWSLGAMLDATPYLSVDASRQQRWRAVRDPSCLNVGLVWRSRARDIANAYTHRSMPLESCRPLTRLSGVKLFGLQVDAASEELRNVEPWGMTHLGEAFFDLSEAGAAISAMDVIVGVDSAVVHLAGALGTPCCIALPAFADARWMTDTPGFTGACPWYPSARLYLQDRAGDWTSVMERVADALAERLLARRDESQLASGVRHSMAS